MDSTQQLSFRELLATQPILSLCSGARGLEDGLETIIGKTKILAYVEIEAFIIHNLLTFMEKGVLASAPIWANLKTFPSNDFYKKVFCIMGGYPCQPFSIAGKRRGKEDPRHLWPYISRIIQTTKPVCCLFENVAEHINLGFDEVSRDLRKMGYAVEAGLYSAEEVGSPQTRKRLFILAIKMEYANGFTLELARSKTRGEEHRPLSNASELGNTKHNGLPTGKIKRSHDPFNDERTPKGKIKAKQFEGANKLANSNSNGYRTGIGTFFEKSCKTEKKEQRKNGKRSRNEPGDSSKSIQLPNSQRNNGCQIWNKSESEIIGGNGTQWPARPGQPQHDWERPRVIESGMDSTANGYNFREDLCRMYGNYVVPQQAAYAIDSLLKKFNL